MDNQCDSILVSEWGRYSARYIKQRRAVQVTTLFNRQNKVVGVHRAESPAIGNQCDSILASKGCSCNVAIKSRVEPSLLVLYRDVATKSQRLNARHKKTTKGCTGVYCPLLFIWVSSGKCCLFTPKLKLGGKVEFNIREFFLCERKRIACVGEEYITTVLINSHVSVLTALEVGELLGVVALNPASFVD